MAEQTNPQPPAEPKPLAQMTVEELDALVIELGKKRRAMDAWINQVVAARDALRSEKRLQKLAEDLTPAQRNRLAQMLKPNPIASGETVGQPGK